MRFHAGVPFARGRAPRPETRSRRASYHFDIRWFTLIGEGERHHLSRCTRSAPEHSVPAGFKERPRYLFDGASAIRARPSAELRCCFFGAGTLPAKLIDEHLGGDQPLVNIGNSRFNPLQLGLMPINALRAVKCRSLRRHFADPCCFPARRGAGSQSGAGE